MSDRRVLSHQEARRFYDRLGSNLDAQRIFEDPAWDVLMAHGDFGTADAVAELGCGTGRLAERLLRELLPAHATYSGFDISPTMVGLTRTSLEPWDRARVHLTEGPMNLPLDDGTCDRFLSTYVLDLLSSDDIDAALREAQRLLTPGGLLCMANMTFGARMPARFVSSVWSAIHSSSPQLVGGSRPIRLSPLPGSAWQLVHHEVVCTLGMCTEVLVAGSVRSITTPYCVTATAARPPSDDDCRPR